MNLQTSVKEAGNAYEMHARRLEKLGIKKIEDFLYHIPFRYEDYSIVSEIGKVQEGETVTVQGVVIEIKAEYTKKWKSIQKAKIRDETGEIDAAWFNQPFLVKYIKKGDRISLSGKVELYLHKLVLQSPEYEIINNNGKPTIHTGRFVPIYKETKGISSKWLRRQIYKILETQKQNILEYLPYSIIENNNLTGLYKALEQIHFPKNPEYARESRHRLAFDELFLIQLSSLQRRNQWEKNIVGNKFSIAKFKKNIENFLKKLPFELTNAQKRVIEEIFADLEEKKPMNRLLQGDVGSGKTVVSSIAMYLSFLNGYQSVLMAPTEILARQHYDTISNLLLPFGVKTNLIIGGRKTKNQRLKTKENFDILVGTHAVLSEKINFNNLSLVVIDEQQRFGVEQRAVIRKKGKNPHFLTMTATPIPRTVALTIYADLDLSYLDEMPVGREIVKTWLVPNEKRYGAYEWIGKQISKNKTQAFVICPFIEESETLKTVKAAIKEYDKLKNEVFKNLRVSLLHGRLKSKDKEEILDKFRRRENDILVATPVVEVGIDIPNATIIIIEAAERFGLSQLHQLRGRVGRSSKKSYCLLFTEGKSEQTIRRLKAMETIHVGKELANLDLKLRGPGEIYGTAQHGVPELRIASFSDMSLIEKTKKEAGEIFPTLRDYPLLIKKIESVSDKEVSPD